MSVWILSYHWNNENSQGAEILGVWGESDFDAAQKAMFGETEEFIKENGQSGWDPDLTWAEETSVQFGYDPKMQYCEPEIYRWELIEMEINKGTC